MRKRLWIFTLTLGMSMMLFTGCARSPQAARDKHLTAGKRLLEKKDYRRAILEFQNAVQALPADAEARYELGLALAESGDVQRGYNNLKRAVELNPKHQQAQLRMAQLMAAARDLAVVKQGQDELKKLADSSTTPEVLNALALTQLRLGEAGGAIQSLQEALTTSPQELSSSIMLAMVKLSQKDTYGAEDVLKRACDSAPNSADPHLILGEFYASQRRGPEAETEFQKALGIDPKKYRALFDLAQIQNAIGEKQKAEQNFKHLANSGEKSYKAIHALFLFENGQQNEAIVEFEALYKQDPSDRPARTRLVAAYLKSDKTSEAERVLTEALKKNQRDADALLQRSEIYLGEGQIGKAQTDVTEALRSKPDDAMGHYRLSKVLEASGEQLQRRQELSESLRLSPSFLAARIELAEALIGAKSPKTALAVVDAAPADQKNVLPILAMRNWVLWALGDMPEMRKGIDAALQRGRSADLLFQDGLWKLRWGNVSEARGALEEALKIDPQDPRPMGALVRSYDVQKQSPMALQRAKEYAAQQPKSAPVQDFVGWMMLSHGDRAQARAAFTAAKKADPQFAKADLSLIQLDLSERKLDDAESKLRALLAANRVENTLARTWLGNIELQKGNHAAALDEFRKVVEADSANPKVLNNFAYLLAEYGKQPGEALKYAEKAVELAPEELNYSDTLGWVLYQKGVYPSAVKYLERANSKPKGDVVWQYHLAMAYAKAGEISRSRSTLDAALKLDPTVPEAKVAREVVGASK